MDISICECPAADFALLGELTVQVYANLPNMPDQQQMPKYYARLRDTEYRAKTPTTKIFTAYDSNQTLLGGVTYMADMAYYGNAGGANRLKASAGFRYLAVSPSARGLGVGKALSLYCIEQAQSQSVKQLVIHTTHSMETAWKMYLKLGFERFKEIDFEQSGLAVFGLKKRL